MIHYLKIKYIDHSILSEMGELQVELSKRKIKKEGFKIVESKNEIVLPLEDDAFTFEITDLKFKIHLSLKKMQFQVIVPIFNIESIDWINGEPENFIKKYMIRHVKEKMSCTDWNSKFEEVIKNL